MARILLIAEKPSVRQDFARILLGLPLERSKGNPVVGRLPDGSELTITNARGHIFAQAKPEYYDPKYSAWDILDLPIVPAAGWKFTHVVANDKVAAEAETLRRCVANHSGHEIINACDPEREGELIFREIIKVCAPAPETKIMRMWWRSNTDDSLMESFKTREPQTTPRFSQLAEAAFARSDADWVYGMNYTVLATKTLPRGSGVWKLWSMGRVQTPTLALIEERCRKVANFVPQPFWKIIASFDGIQAEADLTALSESEDRSQLLGAPSEIEDRQKKAFWKKEKADAFIASAKSPNAYRVTDKTGVKTTKAPLPYDIHEISKFFSEHYGLTAAEALQIMQDLYEKKLLTYPRTDCRHLPEDAKDEVYDNCVRAINRIKQIRPNLQLCSQAMMPRSVAHKSAAFDSSKITDHPAITPTETVAGLETLSGNHLIGYLAVLQRTIMSLDEPATFTVYTKCWEQEGGSGAYAPAVFRAGYEEPRTAGFTRWQRSKEAQAPRAPLPESESGLTQFEEIKPKEGKTSAPKLYTDGTLLDAMKYAGETIDEGDGVSNEQLIEILKDKGIGTGATRANIIDTLVARSYIERTKPGIAITPNGRTLIQEIRKRAPAMASAKVTGEWEMVLSQIRNGNSPINRIQFLDRLLEEFVKTKETFIAGSKRSAASGRKVNITEGTPIEGILCPKSKKPMLDRGDCFEAPGWAGVYLWKTAFGRNWEASEYVELLKAVLEKKTYRAHNLVRQDKTTYSGDLTIDLEAKRVEFYRPEPIKVKEVKCPKTKKALIDYGKYFEAPGWPGVRLYKAAFGRKFEASDWATVLEDWNAGKSTVFTDLVSSKSGNFYSGRLFFDQAGNKVGLSFL